MDGRCADAMLKDGASKVGLAETPLLSNAYNGVGLVVTGGYAAPVVDRPTDANACVGSGDVGAGDVGASPGGAVGEAVPLRVEGAIVVRLWKRVDQNYGSDTMIK